MSRILKEISLRAANGRLFPKMTQFRSTQIVRDFSKLRKDVPAMLSKGNSLKLPVGLGGIALSGAMVSHCHPQANDGAFWTNSRFHKRPPHTPIGTFVWHYCVNTVITAAISFFSPQVAAIYFVVALVYEAQVLAIKVAMNQYFKQQHHEKCLTLDKQEILKQCD